MRPDLTEAERYEIGMKAKFLVTNGSFVELFEIVQEDISAEIMQTAIGEASKRETLFLLFHAMREFRDRLDAYGAVSSNIEDSVSHIENTTHSY